MCRSTILLVDIGEIISEPFDCITCCINIFGFWQRQLNKLSYQPSSTFPKRKPSCVPFVYSSKVTPLLPKNMVNFGYDAMRVFPSQRKKWYIKTSNPSWLQVQRWKPTVRFFHQNPDRARKLVFSHTWPISLPLQNLIK